MSTSVAEAQATRVWFDEENMWVELADGRSLSVPLSYFPRLLNATPNQREQHVISGGGTGLHWDELDEDISVMGLLLGIGDRTRHITYRSS
jgi:hypothetical protein